jgi:ubiquitin-conjugating enzyme E2 O
LDLLKFKTACTWIEALQRQHRGSKRLILPVLSRKTGVGPRWPGWDRHGFATALDLQNQLHGNKTRVVVDVSPPAAAQQRASELRLGDYVVSSGNWLGRVAEVSLDVDVVFDDGTVCRVTSAGRKLRTLDKQGHGNDDGVFYRGQQVVGSSVFKASRWLKGYWKPSRVQGTVAKNKVSGVLVQWLATRTSSESTPPPPAYHHDSRNLTFFCSGDANKFWVVSNRCFFHEEPTPTTATTKSLRRTRRHHHLRRMRQREDQLERSLCTVTNTHTTVDVAWQDGTLQHGVPSWHGTRTNAYPGNALLGM